VPVLAAAGVSQLTAGRFAVSGGRIFSSDFSPELLGNAFGCGVCPAGVLPDDFSAASNAADDSGTGELAGVEMARASFIGGGGGAGSLARGALTDVSPVNGFLYSDCGAMTSRAVGL
jgi:hypothetical protein